MTFLEKIFSIIFTLFALLILFIASTTEKGFIAGFNKVAGIATFISVLLGILWAIYEVYQRNKAHRANQQQLIDNLWIEIKGIEEDLNGWKENFQLKRGLPFFSVKSLNVDRYFENMDVTIINPKELSKVNTLVWKVQDKIVLLNAYKEYLMEELNIVLRKHSRKKGEHSSMVAKALNELIKSYFYEYWKQQIIAVQNDLEKQYLTPLKEIICAHRDKNSQKE